MHPLLRSAGWLRPSLTELRPGIRMFLFFFFRKKASIGGGRAETERCTDSVSLIVIHQALHAAPSTPNAHTHGSSCRFDKAGKEGVMELYGSGQSCQYIERFTTLLSKGLGLLVATKHRGQRMCDSRGGGWRTGKGFVEAWWETTNGVDGSRPAGPLGRETAMMERELTGQRDGQAWKSHQINDEKFSGGKSRSWG